MSNYVEPKFQSDAFNCPNCDVYSHQSWRSMNNSADFHVVTCNHCLKPSIWHDGKMIFPTTGAAAIPNPDMPDNIKKDYLEARNIVVQSPRAACVLLRLCVEKICNEKIPSNDDLNEKIKKLGKQGLDQKIIKALDNVRVIGGEAIHPLTMDLRDDKDMATSLFEMVNYISNWAYTSEKLIDKIHTNLPENKKDAIIKRDHKNGVQN